MRAEAVREDKSLTLTGVGYVRSRGIGDNAIADTDEAAKAINQAVDVAERKAGHRVHSVTVATAGGSLSSQRLGAEVSVGVGPITDRDLVRAVHDAMAKMNLPGRRAIHILPTAWTVDGQDGVPDPRAIRGRRLGVELLVVSVAEAFVRDLMISVERADLQLEGIVAAPFAAGLAVLDDGEMDLGCLCIDMGGSSTSGALFHRGSLVHLATVPVGGRHVTQDMARGLSTSLASAERIKTLHGAAITMPGEDRELIEAPPRGDDPGAGPVVAPASLLRGIIAPRVEETFELLLRQLQNTGAVTEQFAAIVLTGGASQLTGLRELAVRVFDRPVRLGRPRHVPSLANAAAGPAFTAAAGVLHRSVFGPRDVLPSTALSSSRPTRFPLGLHGDLLSQMLTWLRSSGRAVGAGVRSGPEPRLPGPDAVRRAGAIHGLDATSNDPDAGDGVDLEVPAFLRRLAGRD